VIAEAKARKLPVLDATCPLGVQGSRPEPPLCAQGRALILIGHAGHPEVEARSARSTSRASGLDGAGVQTLPLSPETPAAYVTQTTLSVDDTRNIIAALRTRFSDRGPTRRIVLAHTSLKRVRKAAMMFRVSSTLSVVWVT